jgi:DNA (cytosine-5)-methyltransferase 1
LQEWAGFDLGLERAGFEIVAHVEKDENCRKLLAERWPAAVALDDVCTAGAHNLPACDVVVGGSPCQGYSVAGKRKGRDDDRSNLTTEFVRICDELKPDVFVWENVPGVLSMRDNAFGHFLAAMVGEDEPFVCTDGKGWTSAGVATGPTRAVAWRVLDAQWFGVAQRRRRVFMVGVAQGRDGGESGECVGAERVIQILFEPKGVLRDHPTRGETGESVAGCLESRTTGGGFPGTDGACAGHVVPSVAKAVRTPTGGIDREDMHTPIPAVAGCLQERDTKGADSDTKPGHLIPVRNSGRGYWQQDDTAATVGTEARAIHEGTLAVAFKPSHFTRGKDGAPQDVVPPLSADADKGDQEAVVATMFEPRCTRATGGQPQRDLSHCLRADTNTGDGQPCVHVGMAVRRLTPSECERLQGFPDGWTAGFSDSVRYRMLGNAVAVPCSEWIARRLIAEISLAETTKKL